MKKKAKTEFKVITLCGSTKFKEEFIKQAERLTLYNYIVLKPHIFHHYMGVDLDKKAREAFDEMHRKMIDMSDAIVVINKDGYIGKSTRDEIKYAKEQGKKVYYMYVECETDCVYNTNCLARQRALPFYKEFSNKYPQCPYYCDEDK